MTQELYQQAIKFAGEKHNNQKVPGSSANYLLHISNVAMEIMMAYSANKNFDINFALQLAILHDTIEDTNTTYEELKNNFGERIAKGVEALSKNEDLQTKKVRMMDSLERINLLEKEVGMVKIADRITNLQKPPGHWTLDKINHYIKEAKLIRESLSNKNEYLELRLEGKIKEYSEYYV